MSQEQSTIQLLTAQLATAQEQLAALTAERESLHSALVQIGAERDELQDHLQSPDELTAELTALKQQIRDRAHKDVFAKLAKDAKVKEAAIEHLWKVSGVNAEADEPDEKALADVVKRLKTEADYAFDDVEPPNMREAREAAERQTREWSGKKHGLPAPGEVPAGGGRSGRNQGGDGTIVTADMRADPKFMLDPKNKQLIGDAAREGRFR